MSELLKKASNNFSAAELLIQNKNYSPSIHCAYYSCLQIILFLIDSKLSSAWISFQDGIDASKAIDPTTKQQSLHNLYISFIKDDIKKSDASTQRKFSTDIGILKNTRNNSDYKKIEITDVIADNSIELARNINKQLLTHYDLDIK